MGGLGWDPRWGLGRLGLERATLRTSPYGMASEIYEVDAALISSVENPFKIGMAGVKRRCGHGLRI